MVASGDWVGLVRTWYGLSRGLDWRLTCVARRTRQTPHDIAAVELLNRDAAVRMYSTDVGMLDSIARQEQQG